MSKASASPERQPRRQKAKKQQKTPVEPDETKKEEEAESRFDFGGLPNRDLKKNLGCG